MQNLSIMFSIWEKETFYAPQDIIIVGSGFVGLWSAYYLKKKNPKLKITVVDRGLLPTGASTRNAGFACFGSLTELLADEQKMGSDQMLQLVEMRYKGLQQIRAFAGNQDIDLDFCGGYELFGKEDHYLYDDLAAQTSYLNKILKGIVKSGTTYQLCPKKTVSKFQFRQVDYLVKNNLEGYLHPARLLRLLLNKVLSMGVQVLNSVEIKEFSAANGELFLYSNLPVELACRQILVCTNGFAKQLLPELDVEPARGQVLVTSPIEKLPWKGTFHYQEGFYYFRNLGNRILLGGARNKAIGEETTYSFETSEIIQSELERFLQEVIVPGKKYQIEYRWSGIMGTGSVKMPITREISPNVFCCVRMSGMGVALAPVMGKEMARRMI
jgi:glycine/D-amino acid oxidase-like deaminating enzyme